MTPDELATTAIRIIVLARRNVASIRSLAGCFNMSKSAMGRWVQMIEASQLGQHGENSPAISTAAEPPSVPNDAAPDEGGAP